MFPRSCCEQRHRHSRQVSMRPHVTPGQHLAPEPTCAPLSRFFHCNLFASQGPPSRLGRAENTWGLLGSRGSPGPHTEQGNPRASPKPVPLLSPASASDAGVLCPGSSAQRQTPGSLAKATGLLPPAPKRPGFGIKPSAPGKEPVPPRNPATPSLTFGARSYLPRRAWP